MNTRKKAYTGKAVYVVDGCRTPFLRARNRPGPFTAADLATRALQTMLLRSTLDPSLIDEVIFGCVMPGPEEANIARLVALRCGLDARIPAWTVQRNCASGLQALDSAAREIASGNAQVVIAGGVEAMSHAPVLYNQRMVAWLGQMNAARGAGERMRQLLRFRPAMLRPVIGLLCGLTDHVVGLSMGQTAENLAWRFGIEREYMDAYALQSHQRLAWARDHGHLDEIVPAYDREGRVYRQDDGLREDTSMEKLARLRPVFDRKYGRVTAGNSAQITDGATVLMLASAKAVEQHGLPVLGRLLDAQWAGLDPASMGLGPVHAMTPIMQRHRLGIDDIDYWEINEAFAAQVLACIEAWKSNDYCVEALGLKKAMGAIDPDRLNVDGGGISLGHPVGASGARIVLHLLQVLRRNGSRLGMASLCIGGGQGGAMLVENTEAGGAS